MSDRITYPDTQLKVMRYIALEPGPKLIILGAVHGNEICGARGIERIAAELDAGLLALQRGTLTLVPVTNPLAYQRGQRAGDRNLNRNLRINDTPQDYEDRIANVLCPLLEEHEVLLDLHSFHTGGEAFAMLGPENNKDALEPFSFSREEESLALRLGVRRLVDGWLDTYARGVAHRLQATTQENIAERQHLLNTDPSYGVGTTEYMRRRGGYAITLECGQHDDPASPQVAYQAIRNTLAHLKLADLPQPEAAKDPEVLRIYQVIDKSHHLDKFDREWRSFDILKPGDLIGTRYDGSQVYAQEAGYILFPNPNAQAGQEWFYLAKTSTRLEA